MKKIIQYCMLSGLAFIFSSCLFEEKNVFPESAALRLNHAIDNAKTVLQSPSSGNGWVMEYFPTNDTEGYTFLMSFNDNSIATIAARNKYTTTFTADTCYYDVIGDNGPVLTFNTYTKIFHMFSDPSGAFGGTTGLGIGGDYEFILMSVTGDLITLKGKKRGTANLMYPLAQGQDWRGYFDILDQMDANLFNAKIPVTLALKSNTDEIQYYLSNGSSHIFTARSQNQIVADDPGSNIPFIITNYGLRFAQPFIIGSDSVQTFRLSDDKNELICIDNGINAKITALNPADFYLSFINNGRATVFVNSADNMSASVKTAYTVVVDGVTAKARNLDYFQFIKNSTWGPSLAIRTSKAGGTLIEGFFSFTMTKKTDDTIDLAFNGFTGKYDANGKTYYDTYDGVSGFVNMMTGSYKLSIQGNALASTTVRFTSTTDSGKWFDLVAK